jgi:hypothetical protein
MSKNGIVSLFGITTIAFSPINAAVFIYEPRKIQALG